MTSLTPTSLLLILVHASIVNSASYGTTCSWVMQGNSSYDGDGDSSYPRDVMGVVQLNGTLPYPPAVVEPILPEFLLDLSNEIKRRVYTIECEGTAEIYAKLGEQQNKTKGHAQAYNASEYQTVISLYTASRCRFKDDETSACLREQTIMNPKVQKAFRTVLERNTPANIDDAAWLVAGIFAAIFVATCCFCCLCCKCCCCKKADDTVAHIGYIGCVEEQQDKKKNQDTEAQIGYFECVDPPQQEYKNMYPSLSVVD